MLTILFNQGVGSPAPTVPFNRVVYVTGRTDNLAAVKGHPDSMVFAAGRDDRPTWAAGHPDVDVDFPGRDDTVGDGAGR